MAKTAEEEKPKVSAVGLAHAYYLKKRFPEARLTIFEVTVAIPSVRFVRGVYLKIS